MGYFIEKLKKNWFFVDILNFLLFLLSWKQRCFISGGGAARQMMLWNTPLYNIYKIFIYRGTLFTACLFYYKIFN